MSGAVYYGEMKGGKLQCKPFIEALRGLDGTVELTVKKWHPKRSGQANRYYHGVVIHEIGSGLKDAGFEPWQCTHDAVHEMLKYRFLKTETAIGGDGEFVTIVRSTASLTKEEFGEYIEHCIRFAAEYLNVSIPQPGEQMQVAA